MKNSLYNKFVVNTFVITALLVSTSVLGQQKITHPINIVFTSDAHYGIARKEFMGDTNVSAHTVNAAMVKKINTIPDLLLPQDQGVEAGSKVGAIDYIIQTGDIANRMEIPIQSAATSWGQFEDDYFQGIHVKNHMGKPVQLLLAPGNHDISNAIGYGKPMKPLTDPTVMVQICNLMLNPAVPKTNANYDYAKDKINYSKNIGGIHFMFITLWPDSAERMWMKKDLETVSPKTPVVIFCHDQPTCEAKHFTNPVAPYFIFAGSKFENLVTEKYKEGTTISKDDGHTDIEQRGWVKFLKQHTNIKAYFHGNSNYNEFYVYKGPGNDVALNTFRVDSPMKGRYSAKDETRLSFQLISIDPVTKTLTARECLWDIDPKNPDSKVIFGDAKTVSLKVL